MLRYTTFCSICDWPSRHRRRDTPGDAGRGVCARLRAVPLTFDRFVRGRFVTRTYTGAAALCLARNLTRRIPRAAAARVPSSTARLPRFSGISAHGDLRGFLLHSALPSV